VRIEVHLGIGQDCRQFLDANCRSRRSADSGPQTC
jgi:hypothetical protein